MSHLEVGEPVVEVLEVDAGPAAGPPPAEAVLVPLRAVNLVRVDTDLVTHKLRQLLLTRRKTLKHLRN